MDSWFIELFDIISRQRETLKVEMLLKELYGEFDILVRRHSIQELKEIYYYTEEKNQINTVNVDFNENAGNELKQEILKRLVMLDDLSIPEQILKNLIKTHKERDIVAYINTWKSFSFVYFHLKDVYQYELELQSRVDPFADVLPDELNKTLKEEYIEPKEKVSTLPKLDPELVPKPEKTRTFGRVKKTKTPKDKPTSQPIRVEEIKEVIVEKPVEVIKEKVIEKPVEVIKEVIVEKPVEKPKKEKVSRFKKPKTKQPEVVKEVIVEKPVEVIKEVIVEKPVEKEVVKEVIVEKPVEVIKEVIVEKPVEREVVKEVEKVVEVPVEKEVVKEVIVEKPVEVIKEKIVEKPVEVIKEVIVEKPVEKEVIKEVEKVVEVPVEKEIVKEVIVEKPVEVIKEKIVEKPVEVIKEVIVEKPVEVIKEVIVEKPVEVIKEVIKEVPVEKEVIKEVIIEKPVEKIIEKVVEKVVEVPVETETIKQPNPSTPSTESHRPTFKKPKITFERPLMPEAPKVYNQENISHEEKQGLFFNLLDELTFKYNYQINKDVLKRFKNPRPNFNRVLIGYIEETKKDSTYFIELFRLLLQYGETEIMNYIASRSTNLKLLLTFNIGLLNVDDLENKLILLDILSDIDEQYIHMSKLERDLRLYVDSLNLNDQNVLKIYEHVNVITQLAPKMIDQYKAAGAIEYFKQDVWNKTLAILDKDNQAETYWAMILAATLCVCVHRKTDVDYTSSMNCVGEMADHFIKKVDNEAYKTAASTLAKSYIRSIFKQGQLCETYHDWWSRQQDDLLTSKLNNISKLNT